jgi:hypothetical protein
MGLCKRLLYFIAVAGAVFFVGATTGSFSSTTFAANGVDEACKEASDNPYCKDRKTGDDTLIKTIKNITTFIAYMGGIIAVIVVVYGGFRYVVSAGNEQKVATAKDTILYGVIGLVVIIAAQTIVIVILNLLM